jgi:glycosyltransferase involved in cell wall biosynthesis
MIKVHIVDYAGHGWILQKIANEVMELSYHRNLEMSRNNIPNLNADINYYINWVIFTKEQPKSNLDIVFFTHFENIPGEVEILNRADRIVAMSEHGKKLIEDKGIKTKVHVLQSFGTNVTIRKKIRIGFSGRFYDSGRKGEQDILKLVGSLNKDIFQLVFHDTSDDEYRIKNERLVNKIGAEIIYKDINKFFSSIDYFLQASIAEGGPMDILNAIYAGVPIVSRDIGFMYNMATDDDFIYNDIDEAINFFKLIEKAKLDKFEKIANYTWENFRKEHLWLFHKLMPEEEKFYV